jgi:hypothetical protein
VPCIFEYGTGRAISGAFMLEEWVVVPVGTRFGYLYRATPVGPQVFGDWFGAMRSSMALLNGKV